MVNDFDENEEMLMQAFDKQEEDALKRDYVAHAGSSLEKGVSLATLDEIINAIKTVEDPEIMINIYDLGLVYDIRQSEAGDVEVDMTVTSPMCPVAGILPQQTADAIALISGVGKIEVKIVWEPAWTIERLSEDAKIMMEMF